MTLSYTKNLHLAVPDFLTEPWHAEFAQAMDSIDNIVYNAIVAVNTTLWLNSAVYAVGDLIVDPDTGGLFSAAVAHTSSPVPTTFTNERLAHPTFWTAFAPALATQGEAEAGVDNIKYMSPLRVAQAIDAQIAAAGVATQAEAEAGLNNTQTMTPLRTSQSVAVRARATPQGRLTLLSDTPVVMATVNTSGVIYYTPYTGTAIPIWNGTTFDIVDLWDEIPALANNTTHNPAVIGNNKVNDWFIWTDSDPVTLTIATPCVATLTNHGLSAGHPFQLTTTGTLPSPLAVDTTYYVISAGLTANDFQFSATRGGAAINTTASQVGTHTLVTRRLTHGPDWTSDTARSAGAAIARKKGLWVNGVAITNGPAQFFGTYVGSTYCSSGLFIWRPFPSIVAGGQPALLWVYNAYNRVLTSAYEVDGTGSWTYLGGVRPVNGSTNNRIWWVDGLGESIVNASYGTLVFHDANSAAQLILTLSAGALSAPSSGGYSGSYSGYDSPIVRGVMPGAIGTRWVQANEATFGNAVVIYGPAHGALIASLEM